MGPLEIGRVSVSNTECRKQSFISQHGGRPQVASQAAGSLPHAQVDRRVTPHQPAAERDTSQRRKEVNCYKTHDSATGPTDTVSIPEDLHDRQTPHATDNVRENCAAACETDRQTDGHKVYSQTGNNRDGGLCRHKKR
jgi:hypothetical protein